MKFSLRDILFRQAVQDCEIFTRDVLRQLRRGPDQNLAVTANNQFPREVDPQVKGRILVHMDSHFLEFVRSFSQQLVMLRTYDAAVPTCAKVGGAAWSGGGAGEMPLASWDTIYNTALEMERLAADELRHLQQLLNPSDLDGRAKHELRPLIFCIAWHLSWHGQHINGLKVGHILEILYLPFLGALKNSYISYLRLARDESAKMTEHTLEFKPTMPMAYQ